MENKIEFTFNEVDQIKYYLNESLKINSLFTAFLSDERIDKNIRKKYGEMYRGLNDE